MRRTLKERKALISRLPWVKPLPPTIERRCEGIKWSHLSLKAMRVYHREGLSALPEKARCKRRAWFGFKALKPRGSYPPPEATSGFYCYDHLCMQIGDHEKERDRLDRWLVKNAPDWT